MNFIYETLFFMMNESLSLDNEDTLPDDAWKDSFDKLLDERQALRAKNIIKRDVRASFNMNSSYENSCYDDSAHDSATKKSDNPVSILTPKLDLLKVPSIPLCKGNGKSGMISTPVKSPLTDNPFKCTLSPICTWNVQHKCQVQKKNRMQTLQLESPTSNAIRRSIDNFKSIFAHELQAPSVLSVSQFSPVVGNTKAKRSRKQVCFNTNIVKKTPTASHEKQLGRTNGPSLQPGKWRKSLSLWRQRMSVASENGHSQSSVVHNKGHDQAKISSTASFAGCRKSTLNRLTNAKVDKNNFESELMRRCGQKKPLKFDDFYTEKYLRHCCKIGEGAFGEVFLYKNPDKTNKDIVYKIIPIEGKNLINGESQKSFEQILQEVVICMELCGLNDTNRESNFARGFVNLEKVRCVVGQYPAQLQKLWEDYDDTKKSENDHPECFDSSQMFVIFEMAFSGQDLECFIFRNAEQAFYTLLQIIYTLAVGEEVYQFEHRDLHLGNVLVLATDNKYISYKINDKILTLPTKGIHITIIDYTLSRITYNNVCYFNDLSCDEELFTATGDYQFDIYRMMREILNNKWEIFEPKTNIFWISYIISKMLNGVSYKNFRSKVHLMFMKKLSDINSSVLTYKSCKDFAMDLCSKQS